MADIELLEGEEWRPVVGYEGQYEVSNMGRVRSIGHYRLFKDGTKRYYKGQLLKNQEARFHKSQVTNSCYSLVTINRKPKKVHLLVAEAFLGPKPNGNDVLHLNGIKSDNRVCNLKYGTRLENMVSSYSYGGKMPRGVFDIKTVLSIRRRLDSGESARKIAREYKVASTTIQKIKSRKTFAWLKEDGSIVTT